MSERDIFILLVGYVIGQGVMAIHTLINEYIDRHVGCGK